MEPTLHSAPEGATRTIFLAAGDEAVFTASGATTLFYEYVGHGPIDPQIRDAIAHRDAELRRLRECVRELEFEALPPRKQVAAVARELWRRRRGR